MNKRVLDQCCGSKMFWFDQNDPSVLFTDCRTETHELKDKSSRSGSLQSWIASDLIADFRALPFDDGAFKIVVFCPPHLLKNGREGWLAKKYGQLDYTWRDYIHRGFLECFRVLDEGGVLIFKWNEQDIRVSEILALTDHKPLFGNKSGKRSQTHWIVFMKPMNELVSE